MEKKVKDAQDIANKLLELLGTEAKASAEFDKKAEAILINIETDSETGLLIGRHGETLDSLQGVISMMLFQKHQEWYRVLLNLGDWREKQEERLNDLAKQASERAKQTGDTQNLYNLNATQRRIVHLELSKDTDVETESVGEGVERYLTIRPKK